AVQFLVQELAIRGPLSVAQLNHMIVIDFNFVRLAMLIPQRLARDVLGYSKQPGRELGIVPQRLEVLVRAHESLLSQLLGQVAAPDHIIDKTDNWPAVAIEDQAKRLVLAAPGARY